MRNAIQRLRSALDGIFFYMRARARCLAVIGVPHGKDADNRESVRELNKRIGGIKGHLYYLYSGEKSWT